MCVISIQNFGLGLGGEIDALGVAATLDVEHTAVPPRVLVVTNLQLNASGKRRVPSKQLFT